MLSSKNLVIVSLVSSAGALVIASYGAFKMVKAANTLNAKIDDLVNNTVVDIPDAIIETATQRAVDKTAKEVASSAASKIAHEFDDDIRTAVNGAIAKEKESLRSEIKEEIKKKVGNIDISEAKEEVISEAKREVSDRLSNELDGIKAEYNKHLNDVKDIYSSIAKDIKSAAL